MSVHETGGTTVPTFADLGLPQALVTTLADQGITTPFPIQAATLPDSLAGRDVLGRGRTGSGKTYAFLLPMVTRLTQSQSWRAPGRPRALILAPTRELVAQIDAALAPLAAAMHLRRSPSSAASAPTRRSRSCATAWISSSPARAGWRIT